MIDLVKRLRRYGSGRSTIDVETFNDAADRIEELEAELEMEKADCRVAKAERNLVYQELEQVQATIERVRMLPDKWRDRNTEPIIENFEFTEKEGRTTVTVAYAKSADECADQLDKELEENDE